SRSARTRSTSSPPRTEAGHERAAAQEGRRRLPRRVPAGPGVAGPVPPFPALPLRVPLRVPGRAADREDRPRPSRVLRRGDPARGRDLAGRRGGRGPDGAVRLVPRTGASPDGPRPGLVGHIPPGRDHGDHPHDPAARAGRSDTSEQRGGEVMVQISDGWDEGEGLSDEDLATLDGIWKTSGGEVVDESSVTALSAPERPEIPAPAAATEEPDLEAAKAQLMADDAAGVFPWRS